MQKIRIEKYQVPAIYTPLFYDETFIKLLYGSRNSVKSDFACLKMVVNCLELKYFKCLMVRRVKEAVKKSIYDTIKTVCKRYKIEHLFDFRDHVATIVCKANQNMFIPTGTYETVGSTGKAKSVNNPTHAIVDEMDELTESEFSKLIYSLRGSETMEVFGIFNTHTVDESHWIFKRWFPPVSKFEKKDGSHTYVGSKRSNTIILHTTYKMNPYLNAHIHQEFEDQKKYDYENYEIDGLGLIKQRKESNLALKYFSNRSNVNEDIILHPHNMVYLSWDFNRLPHHTVGVWQAGGTNGQDYVWNLVKEFCLPDHSIQEVQREINSWLKKKGYKNKTITIICDYSGNTRRDHGATSDVNKIKAEIAKGGFSHQDATIVNPSVTASLDFLNDMFAGLIKMSPMRGQYGGMSILIQCHPSCVFHIADFAKTKTDLAGKILKVVKREVFFEEGQKVSRSYQARGHAVDGARYMATAIFNSEFANHNSQYRQ